jgi:pimeloyl-ACP methyl ester carboxylesterase
VTEAAARSLTVEGLRLSYRVAGEGPVCVVHPGGPGVGWEYLRLPHLERDFTLVYVEPIGTGESARLPDPNEYTLDRYSSCLAALIAQLESESAWVLGHSHGGFVALQLALTDADLVDGLVLYDTAARTGEEWLAEAMQNIEAFAERHTDRAEAADIIAALDEEATATTDEQLTSVFRRQFPVYFADYWGHEERFAALRESVQMYAGPNRAEDPTPYDIRGDLALIGCPSLVIVGSHDVLMPPRWSEELSDAIPDSELLVLDRSGHFGHLEEPERFADAVRGFVERKSAAAA